MIGWYAHHHGNGHIVRAQTVLPHLTHPATLFSSRASEGVTLLPTDVDRPRTSACGTLATPGSLHYAPVGVDGLRERMTQLSEWVRQTDPDLFVVDVSVEVTLLMRLLSVPTAVMRQHGRRDDDAHRLAYDSAAVLMAPWGPELEDPNTPPDIVDRTTYVGGFSRFDGRPADRAHARQSLGVDESTRLVVVIEGSGGQSEWPVEQTASTTPAWHWVALGNRASTAHSTGWVEDPWNWLSAADVLVTHAGHNAVMECAATGRPTMVIPQDRPFDEQVRKAAVLELAGAGMIRPHWPASTEWTHILNDSLDDAMNSGAATLRKVNTGRGARCAAQILDRAALQYGTRS